MMDRRQFLRRSALIAAGVIAADQLDVLEMLAPRRLFAGASFAGGVTVKPMAYAEMIGLWPSGLTDVLTASSLHTLRTSTWMEQFPYAEAKLSRLAPPGMVYLTSGAIT